MVRIFVHRANNRRMGAKRMISHCRQQLCSIIFSADRDQFAFIGDIKRVKPEKLTGRIDRRIHWQRLFLQHHADPRLPGDFIQCRGQSTARRIAQHMDIGTTGPHRGDQAMQRSGIGDDGRFEAQALTLGHDRHAMIAERAGHQNDIAGQGIAPGQLISRRNNADARCRDEHTVALAALNHFRIAGHHRHTSLLGRRRHALHDARQIGELESFFKDEASR